MRTVAFVIGVCLLAGCGLYLAPPDALAKLWKALALEAAGEYSEALPLCQSALRRVEKSRGPDHPLVASYQDVLGNVYWQLGDLTQAMAHLQRALQIEESTTGARHRAYISTQLNLGTVNMLQGDYTKAESFYLNAARNLEAQGRTSHHNYVYAISSLAELYYLGQGEPTLAKLYAERSLGMQAAVEGTHNLGYVGILTLLGKIALKEGDKLTAEGHYLKALRLLEKFADRNSIEFATILHSLGVLYRERGTYAMAHDMLQRSLQVKIGIVGVDHWLCANTLHELGRLAQAQGAHAIAEGYYARALTLTDKSLPFGHPELAMTLAAQATLRVMQGQLPAALPLLQRALLLSEQQLAINGLSLPDTRLASFLDGWQGQIDLICSLVLRYPQSAPLRALALGAALLRKGRAVTEAAALSSAVYRRGSPSDKEAYARLRSLRNRHSNLSIQMFHWLGIEHRPTVQGELDALIREEEQLEQWLAGRFSQARPKDGHALDSIIEETVRSLPSESVLIELVQFRPIDLQTLQPVAANGLHYIALSLQRKAGIGIADLGAAAPIDAAIHLLLDANAKATSDARTPAREAYRRIMPGLLPLLGDKTQVLIDPDGQLNLLPFAALHDGKGFLVDRFLFSYLTSGLELLSRERPENDRLTVVVFADPAFAGAASDAPSLRAPRGHRCLRLPDQMYERLPFTRREAEAIKTHFRKAHLLLGPDATDTALLNLPEPPGILHVATHGYFRLRQDESVPAPSQQVGRGLAQLQQVELMPPDPLLRSGLLLAGGRRGQTRIGMLPEELEEPDGLVTALEMMGMNLWGTQLVVLSACETGQGDVESHPGQGVYGLRRALITAGAETLVTSLWKVDDEVTKELMDAYYRLLDAHAGRAAALRQAALEVKQRKSHPHFWGAFICIGRTEPLHGFWPARKRSAIPLDSKTGNDR